MHKQTQSTTVYQKLCQVIPGGVNSPVRACREVDHHPLVAKRGQGAVIVDVDGNEFIDYCGAWGSLIHGHAHPKIVEAVKRRVEEGSSFGVTTEVEERLARKIIQSFPSVEKIRFVSSGTEATMSAARLARGYTGKNLIIKFEGHYHGHADFFLIKAGSGVATLNPTSTSKGIPEEILKYTRCLPFNDIKALTECLNDPFIKANLAAIILEPIAGNMGLVPASVEFMQALRQQTQALGALLILDEVITGFRVAKGGAQELYQVDPDLTTFGKIIGGGFPAAAFGGKAKIMDYLAPLGPVYQAGTLSGNPVAMEAGYQALCLLDESDVYKKLQGQADKLIRPIQAYIEKHAIKACIQSCGSMFTLFFGVKEVKHYDDAKQCNKEAFKAFFRHMYSKGIYVPPLQLEAWFVSTVHTEAQLLYTVESIIEFLKSHR